MHKDYDLLAAAHLLRSPDMASRFGPLMLLTKPEGAFFRDFFLRDVVLYGIRHFLSTGLLLHPAALKTDISAYIREGASAPNYEQVIDSVWQVDNSVLINTKDHLASRLTEDVQVKLAQSEDWLAYCKRGGLDALKARVDEIMALSAVSEGDVKSLSEGLLEDLRDPPIGVSTGLDSLDACLTSKGICEGEVAVLLGFTGIGKSILLHHIVRHSAKAGRVVLLWSHETGEYTTRRRLLKGFTGLTDHQISGDPEAAYRQYISLTTGNGMVEPYVEYSPPGQTSKAQMLVTIDRIEQKLGKGLDLLAVDYSEKRAANRDWQTVCDAYQEIREICGERRIAGVDIAQENSQGALSYKNIRKDTDILVHFTIKEPMEWAKICRSYSAESGETQQDIEIPTKGPVWGRVIKAREGEGNRVFQLWMDRSLGLVIRRPVGEEMA